MEHDQQLDLVDVLEELLHMVRQYAQAHDGRLWSANLGAPANAMRVLDHFGLLEDVQDLANRDVWATDSEWSVYDRKLAELRQKLAC